MALFEGEEMVPVTTPDGRTITVPKSLSGMVPAQAPFAPSAPPMNPSGQPVQELPPEYLTPPPPEPAPTGTVEMGEPDITPVMTMEPEVVTADPKRVAKARQQKAAYDASPAGKQAAAQNAQNAAAAARVDAITSSTDVEAATNDLVHGALQERNAVLAKAEADRLAAAQKVELERQGKVTEIEGYRKKIENTKIDRTADHPILAAISAALAGLGSAMKGEKIDTLDILYKAIDRKVAAQEADLDQMGRIYGMKKDDLELLKEKKANTLEFHNAMVAAEVNKSIRTIEDLTSRSASEKTRANGKMMIAELQQHAADRTMEATRWGLEYDQRDKHQRAQIGLGYSQLRQADKHFNATQQLRREEIAADMAKALAATRASGDQGAYKMQLEAAKEARQFGVRDMSGDFLLAPQGRAKMEEAARLETEAARMESNPDVMARSIASDKVVALRNKAAILRGEAQTFDTIKAHNETEAIAVSNMISSGQSVVQLIDNIKELSDQAGRGLIKRSDAQAKLQAMFQQLKPGLKEAWQLGAWDKGSAALVESIIGADPTSDWNVGVLGALVAQKMIEDPKAFHGRLDSVATDLENKAKNKLVGIGAKFGAGDTVLQRKTEPEPISASAVKLSAEPSGTEIEKNADDVGVVGKTVRSTFYPLSPSHAEEAQNAQSVKYMGLSKDQEAPFEERLQAYKAGDKRAGEELVLAVKDAAESGRTDLAVPLLHNLREHAPKTLYQAARATLPRDSDVDKQMAYEENIQIGTGVTPTPMLSQTVINSIDAQGRVKDIDGYRDLGKRAGEGDLEAKRAILEIAKQSGYNRTLPRGSVFNKGGR